LENKEMSGWFIVTLILSVITIGLGVAWRRRREVRREERKAFGVATLVGAIVVLGSLLLESTTIVDPRHVAVVTSFGQPVDTVDNGLHFMAPWSKSTEFDGTVQSLTLTGKQGDDNHVQIRLADQSTAWVDVVLQWRIDADDEEGVQKLYADYRDPVRVDENFVERQVRAAVYDAFADYVPQDAADRPIDFAAEAKGLLEKRMGTGGIVLVSLTIPAIDYDAATEQRLNNLRALKAERIEADVRKEIAQKTAEANNILAQGAKDAGTLYQKCLDLTRDMLAQGRKLPATWNCSPGDPAAVVPVK